MITLVLFDRLATAVSYSIIPHHTVSYRIIVGQSGFHIQIFSRKWIS